MSRCPWKIRWASAEDAQCDKDAHLPGNTRHESKLPNGVTTLSWYAGDRREFTGDWPGRCTLKRGCVLHTGHRGSCAV